jgi:hypothetical protein
MLIFILYGFFGFFLLSSVRGHVEPHWTAAAFPPLVILALLTLQEKLKVRKWLVILGFATLPIVAVLRLYLMIDFLPMPQHVSRMFHQQDTWVRQIQAAAGERPVIFRNKFQYPSIYRFYTGKPAFTRNSMYYRRNQYDVWNMENELRGKKVFLTGYGGMEGIDTLETVFGRVYFWKIDRYCSYNNLRLTIREEKFSAEPEDTITIPIRIENPNAYNVCLDCPCDIPPYLIAVFSDDKGDHYFSRMVDDPVLTELKPGESVELSVRIRIPAPAGHYRMNIAFRSKYLNPGINGKPVKFEITAAQDRV